MSEPKTYRLAAIAAVCGLCCLFTACASLEGKMNHYHAKIRSQMQGGNWNEANRIIEKAEFGNDPGEQKAIDNWRSREQRFLKQGFAKHLQQKVGNAYTLYMNGSINKGNEYMNLLNDELTVIPECLSPCIDLAKSQISSDCAIAEMVMAYTKFYRQVEQIDINAGKDAVRQLEAIDMECEQVDKKESEVDHFKNTLADAAAQRWAPMDISQYEATVQKMKDARNEFKKLYKTNCWNARVVDRKRDYRRIEELLAAKHYEEAKKGFMSLAWLIPPEGLREGMEFDDLAERTQIAGEGIGEMVVKELMESGLTGVQYHRLNKHHVIISALVIGRVPVEDKANMSLSARRREARQVACIQAKTDFARFFETSVQAKSQMSMSEVDGKIHEDFRMNTQENVEAQLSHLVLLATDLSRNKDGLEEVVCILGWRDSAYGGSIVPKKMKKVEDTANLSLSPSIGAYL